MLRFNMIPLHKFEKLPRHQQLRKAAKIIGMAERKIVHAEKLSAQEIKYIAALLHLLEHDAAFTKAAAKEINSALSVFSAFETEHCGTESGGEAVRRVLNNVNHVLLSEIGVYRSDWDFIGETGALDSAKRRPFLGMQVYLEDIRSPFNVGSMFRAAESFGAEKIWLSPLCADPQHKRSQRTAMGCVDVLPWERVSNEPFNTFCGGPFFALETGGTPLEEFSFPRRGVLIAGSEELGVSPEALAAADASLGRVSIASYGAKGSLNVSVAFGIVMHAWAAALKREPASAADR